MCVVSMVMDHFGKRFEPLYPYPNWPRPTIQPLQPFDPVGAKVLIDEFKKAVEAARTVDKLTNQPDCEDPEKAKLEARVAELERLVERLVKENGTDRTSGRRRSRSTNKKPRPNQG